MHLRCNFFSFWDIYDVPTCFSVISMLKHGRIIGGSVLNCNMYYQNLIDATYHDKIQDYLSTVARIAQIVSLKLAKLIVVSSFGSYCYVWKFLYDWHSFTLPLCLVKHHRKVNCLVDGSFSEVFSESLKQIIQSILSDGIILCSAND